MLSDEEASAVLRDIGAIFALYSKPVPTSALLNLLLDDIEGFGLPVIQKAMRRLRVTYDGRSPITSALLIGACESVCGRLSGDEAWSLALRVRDERKTLIWTDEIARAWGMASELMQGRADLVGARRAFLDSYERICHNKRELGALPRAELTLGLDADSHAVALREARERGIDISQFLEPESVLRVAIERAGGSKALGIDPPAPSLLLGFSSGGDLASEEGEAEEEAARAKREEQLQRIRDLRQRLKLLPFKAARMEEARREKERNDWLNAKRLTDEKAKSYHQQSIETQASKQTKKPASKQTI